MEIKAIWNVKWRQSSLTLIFHLNFFLLAPSSEVGELFGVASFTGSFLSPITEMERGNKSASGRSIWRLSYLSKFSWYMWGAIICWGTGTFVWYSYLFSAWRQSWQNVRGDSITLKNYYLEVFSLQSEHSVLFPFSLSSFPSRAFVQRQIAWAQAPSCFPLEGTVSSVAWARGSTGDPVPWKGSPLASPSPPWPLSSTVRGPLGLRGHMIWPLHRCRHSAWEGGKRQLKRIVLWVIHSPHCIAGSLHGLIM